MERLKDKPFTILGINSDSDSETVRKVIEKERMTWPVIIDGGMVGGPIATQWNIRSWPTLFLIDDEGIIRCWGSQQNVELLVDELVSKVIARTRGSH